MDEPTEEGKRRYPETGGYYIVDEDERIPCTCKPTCPVGCKGECGCKAEQASYADFLSGE